MQTLLNRVLTNMVSLINDVFSLIMCLPYFKVRGIETIATYDKETGEFVINTPCESAQKYWIGGAANVSI